MELRDLTYICTIAQCGSISKAAKKLYLAQSSLSQFLKNYEEGFGHQLFHRTTQGLQLTYAGELYIKTAEQILELRRNLLHQLTDVDELKRGRVIFGLSPYRAPYLLPNVIPLFKKAYPQIKIEIVEANILELETLLLNSEVDMGFVSQPLNNEAILVEEVINEEIFIAAHKDFALCNRAYPTESGGLWLDIRDVIHLPFLLLYSANHQLRKFSEMVFARYELEPDIAQTHDNFETIIRLAAAGMGLTFLPETYIENTKDLEYFSIGSRGMYRSLVLGFPPTGYVSKATRVFADTIKEVLLIKGVII